MVASTVPAAARGPLPHERCPHCGNVAVIEPSSTLRFVCGICGKARVPIDDPKVERGLAEVPVLAQATAARNAAVGWKTAGAAGAALGALSLLVFLLVVLVAHPPVVADIAALVAALAPIVFAMFGFGRAKARSAAIEPLLDQGWLLAARDAIEGLGTTRAETLGKAMRVTPEAAEQLLMQLDVEGAVRSRVLEEGALEFMATRPRVRVGEPTQPASIEELEEAAHAGETRQRGL